MPIFDNELIDNTSNRGAAPERPYLASPDTLEVDVNLNPVQGGNIGGNNISRKGMSIDEMSSLTHAPSKGSTFSSPMGMIRRSELIDNQRYPLFQRGVDLENVYALQQGALTQLGHSLAKTGIRAAGTFAQSLTNIPNAISAAKNKDFSKLAGDPNGYEGGIDHWVNNFENTIPNYYSRYEREHPHLAMIPGFSGSANFWGESVLKNLGFTAGAIAGAALQDLAIGVLTEGIGEIPLIASQIGKASLWFNKILSGTNDAEKILDIAKAAGAGQKALLSAESLARAAAYTKVANGFRYGTSLIGSAMTEAGVEGRDSYETIKKKLLEDYKLDHPGEEITAEEAAKIEEYATNAMNTRFGINMALLTVSNAIQFDNLFKSFSNAEKGVVGSLTKTLEDTGKIGLKEGSLDVFEKKVAGSTSEKIWDVVKPKLTNVLSEGIYEEGGQFAAERGVYDYYTRKYKNFNNPEHNKSWNALNETLHSTSYGLAEQFNTTEGIDNMLIGGLTAVITGGIQGKIDQLRGNGKDARLTSSINMLNKYGLTGILSNKYDNTLNSIGIAKEMEDAANSKNIFKYKNLKHDMFFNFVQSRIPSGMHDVTIDQLNMLKDLSKEDFEKTFGMDFNTSNQKTVAAYVDRLIDEANSIKETTDAINNTYKNPFKFTVDPKTEEESLENLKYGTFESWKTDLSYFNSVKTDSNDRLQSIQNDLSNINPMLTNSGLANILDRESLTELAKSYEEEANRLNNTITEYTSNADKRSTRAQVKALRTNSEKINIALSKNDLDLKTFHSLLNFELNNQDATKDDVIGLDKAPDVYNLGADVVQHNLRKKQAVESFNNLSTKEGFDKYFKQAEDIANNEVDEEDLFPSNKKEPTFVNDSKQREKLEVGREYEIDKTRRVNIRKIADDRYQVTAPDGTVSFHKTKESAQEEAKDLSNENTNLSKVKVLGITEDGLVKVEDVNGDILNIDPKRLRGYRSIETEEEKLAKSKETLDRELEQLAPTGGSVETIPTPANEFVGSDDKRKDVDIVFLATTSPSEDDKSGKAINNLPHIVRAKTFLNNFKFFTNRNKIKAILVTPNNAKELGLEGIVQMSYDKQLTDSLTEEETDVNNGFMAQVFIVQTKEGDFFVNDKGEKISKVGEENPTILNDVIFQTMTSASLYTEGGYEKIRKGQEEEAERALEAYKLFRKDVFAQKGYTPYSFSISRGIPRQYVTNGVYEDNHMSDILGPNADRIIAEQDGLITVITTGKVEHNGELLSFPLGTTLIQYGDLLDFANNKKLTNNQANNIFAVINAMAKDLIAKSSTDKAGKLNYDYFTFLRNVLYWKFKGEPTSPSQISIDTNKMEFRIGDKSFPFSKIEESKKEILDVLQNAFISVNNKTLTEEGTSKKFTEYVVDKQGNLVPIEWKNYQSYLLANKYPDGSSRSVEETPLITHTSKPTDVNPSYKQKYSFITDKDVLPYDRVPAKEAKPASAVTSTSVTKIGKYEVNTGKVETFDVSSGPVLFTATLSPEGEVSVEIKDNDTTRDLATNQSKIDYIDKVLTKDLSPEEIEVYNQKLNEDKVSLFLSNAIRQSLEKEYKEQSEVKQEAPKVEEKKEEVSEEKPYDPSKRKRRGDAPEYRQVGKDSSDRMSNSELEIFKQWHAEKVSFIPFEVLENIIKRGDIKAWGVFEDGVAKFVRGGLRGTEYHEIFEAIWADFLTEEEKNNLLTEFRNKKGEFTDRQSGKKIAYSDATDKQVKERIADDFSDFRLGKLPARSLGEAVRNFFRRIMDFFKSFVAKPSLKEELFKAIDSGRFKETKLSERAKALAPEYRAIEGLTEEQTNNYVNDMVFQVSRIIFREGNKDAIFNPEKLTGKQVFDKVRKEYESLGEIDALGEKRYNELVKKTIESIRTRGISFNADEVVSINDENSNGREYAQDPFSVDWKKHSTGALKFLLSTLAERKALNQTNVEKGKPLQPAAYNLSNEGYKLLNFNRVFSTLLDRLHNTNNVDEFTNKFIELAKEDSNYLSLFVSLGGNVVTHSFDFDNFGESDWKLFIQFFNTFSRQKPDALIQYTNDEGDVHTGSANIFTTVKQTVDSWVDNMKVLGKAQGGLISFDKAKKIYKIDTVGIKALSIKKSTDQIKFLNQLGVEFDQGTYNALSNREAVIKGKKTTEVSEFADAVSKIQKYLGKNNNLMTFDGKKLGINGPLRTLATLYTKVNNPNQDSTYFGVEGQRIGSFSENNAPSYFENTFNESETLDELLEKMPQLNDVYSRGSEVLKPGGLFFDENRKRIATISVGYIQGSKNELTGKDKSTAKLSRGERFVQEMNQNINGNYYVLIPGDSSTEWMMNLGNVISMEDVMSGKHWNKVYSVYSNYLNDDINLALADRKQNIYQRARSQELRIMRDILPQGIVKKIENMIQEGKTYDDIQEYINKNRDDINSSVKDFIEGVSKETFDILLDSNQIQMVGMDGYSISKFNTEFLKKYNLTGKVSFDEVMNLINFTNINYEINNQEYHKILFGDPYQFKTEKGKLDETKRIKSFLSGRRRTFDHPAYNSKLKEIYNTVDGIELKEGTPGHHEYKPYTNTVTFNDVNVVGSLANINTDYAKVNETDAMSWLMDGTHKEIALKEGQWSDEAEAFHQWHMAYTRRAFDKKGISKYTSEQLKARDAKLLDSPMPKHKLAVRKPIISGNKNNKTELDIVLDKTSQMPIYYHMVENTSLENMYIQMFKQNVGYGIVASGRKVGAEGMHDIYNDNGLVNTNEFENIVEVPWKIYGTQVETMSEGEKTQTRGSQLTKMSTMDLYENGEPIGATNEEKEEIQKAVERNTKALDLLNENAYNELLDKLGVVDLGDGYALEDKQRISDTLMYEMMRRDLSENAKDTIQLEDGEFIMPFEASPSYVQIKNILYSMVNKALISPSMNGAPHVQAPVTMFEKATEGRSLTRKIDDKWTKITKAQYAALSEEEKKGVLLTDDTLKFYEDEDGKRYCEVMLPHWFKSKFGNMTDDQILSYLNTTEGKKILTGIGFRIPTQALSSVEVFRVKGFLPQYMGYTVIVPSEITTKAGSDFDIDKLNMYLKSVYVDRNGNVKLVKWLGTEQATKDFFTKVYDDSVERKALKKAELIEAVDTLVYGLEDTKGLIKKYGDYILSIQDKYDDPAIFRAEIEKELDKLTDDNINAELRQSYVNTMYKKALENEYYDSLEELLTLPVNFNKLITPVDDAGLEKISEVLDGARGYNEADVKGRLINRNFMTNMRHAFITGKRWVGIAAVNITNLSLRQKSKVYLDPSKTMFLSPREMIFFANNFGEDFNIVLPHNTLEDNGKTYVSLSGTKTADGTQLISNRLSGYATAFVDIANKPFITKIIKSDTVVSTFMFLEAIGAGNTGIYFLNQPIIEKYLEYLDSIGSKNVTGKMNLKYIRNQFPTTDKAINEARISVDQLLDNIKEYSEKGEFYSDAKYAEQQLILNEFIKYKILADQLFSYTQSTNYDTTRFGSSDALLKKEWATFNASNFNLITNVDDVLKNTFIGKQADLLSKSFASFGAIMKTELPEIKAYTISTLKKYATRKYMSMDDYEKIANLIKNSFVDYVIQNNTTISNMVKPLLVDSETAVVNQLEQAKQKYPNMQILKDLVPVLGNRDGGAKSIQLKANVKDAYSENLYVGMMRELRDANPELNALYNNIVNVAILQGTAQSAISIRNIIPVEDYAARIAPIIDNLQPTASLEAFENGMFERNNFANPDVFAQYSPYAMESYETILDPNTGEDMTSYYFPSFRSMKGATKASRRLIVLSDVYDSFHVGSDFLKIPKVITNWEGKKINVTTGLEVTAKDYAMMKQKGSQDLYDAYYYKKVYTKNVNKFGNPIPLTTIGKTKEGDPLTNYYYKLINVYGDGNRAVEFNTDFTRSVIDNGSISTPFELDDNDIINAFAPQIQEEVVSLPTKETVEQPKLGEQLSMFGDTITLRDGNEYNKSDINSNMLEAMGYTPQEIGKILKSIC